MIIITSERSEIALISAGWAGFSEIELSSTAVSVPILDRDISLNKVAAENTVREFIIKNLALNANLTAKDTSFISDSRPIIIEEITVFNPADLPATASNGSVLNRTTIHMVVQIPIEIAFVGEVYGRMNVFVDIDSFKN
ncbi:hypothetical protein JYU21_01815 [Alkaliphilus sp. AH-315-G20]|nr:hypothetical protein [Alkaliphilus sp. AH-315-G20]